MTHFGLAHACAELGNHYVAISYTITCHDNNIPNTYDVYVLFYSYGESVN